MVKRTIEICSLPFVLAVVACGGSATPAESANTADSETAVETAPAEAAAGESAEQEQSAEDGKMSIPTSCHDGDAPCTADPKWVKKLCKDVYPGVALYLFQKSSPFTRGYLTRKTKAVNASGGATSGEEWLAFDEEVVLLHHRAAPTGGMQVSGAMGGYEAMRLDGSCVTLGSDEVRLDVPPQPKYTAVPWRFLGDDVEKSLLQVQAIKEAYIARRKECKGAYSGSVSLECVKKDEKLNRVIIDALNNGETDLPQPESRP